jgi:outer membrane protein
MRNPSTKAPSALIRRSPFSSLARRIAGPALAASALFGAVLVAPSPAAAQPQSQSQSPSKFAVIDVRRAVLETEEGLRVQATLKKLFDSRQVELDNKQRALGQEKEELDREAQGGKTPKDTLQRKYEGLQKRALELQSLTLDYQREMQRKESELTTPILQRIIGIIRRIASQDGYEMILEKPAVPYYRADLEITDRTIQLYNSGQTGDGPAAPSKGPAAPAKTPAPAKQPAAQPPAQPKKK